MRIQPALALLFAFASSSAQVVTFLDNTNGGTAPLTFSASNSSSIVTGRSYEMRVSPFNNVTVESITLGVYGNVAGPSSIRLFLWTKFLENGVMTYGNEGTLIVPSTPITLKTIANGGEYFTFSGLNLQLDAGTTFLIEARGGTITTTTARAGITQAAMTSNSSLTFLGFGSTGGSHDPSDVYAFSISGTSAVPEPSTYGLILGGLALAGAAVRRRRAKA
jgi:hypothetical protein